MQAERRFRMSALAAAAALALTAGTSFAASEFVGVWKVKDSDGKAFQITLSEDGGAAVVTWDTGWITKIAKEGSGYKKTAFKKGAEPLPKNSSDAEKVK